jgi:hypothetical protein
MAHFGWTDAAPKYSSFAFRFGVKLLILDLFSVSRIGEVGADRP